MTRYDLNEKGKKIFDELVKRLVFSSETNMFDNYNNRYTVLRMKKGYDLIVTLKHESGVKTDCHGRHYRSSKNTVVVNREGFDTKYFKSLESFSKALAFNLI